MKRCLIALLFAACDRDSPAPAPAPHTDEARVDASDLVRDFQCTRCHDAPTVVAAPVNKHCTHCHQEIYDGTFVASPNRRVDPAVLARWRPRVAGLRWAPSLALADRLRRDWVRAFLLAPHDIRPGLVAEMPRLEITAEQADRLAAYIVPEASDSPEPAPSAEEVARGRTLFARYACASCHRFTGGDVTAASATDAVLADDLTATAHLAIADAIALAPDLRYTRDRMTTVQIARWIVEPRGAMPALGISAADARSLAAYLVGTPLAPQTAWPLPQRLPILDREVTWDELEPLVFRRTCWHCHAEPDFARGDGGPGNSGGFGFAARGLDLSSYSSISAGSLDDAGERRSVFAKLTTIAPLPDGTPRLVAHLLARHVEEAGGIVEGIRGMPLGLPPLPLETIQLVDTWIAQGRPRGTRL